MLELREAPKLGRQRLRRERVQLLGAQQRQRPDSHFFAFVQQIVVELATGNDHTGNSLDVVVPLVGQQRMEFVVSELGERRVRRPNAI